ncbi:hypothetical protein CYMTET_30939 [Cymbomonas tetramitiformis]|uniref:Uncharacterized protein n=1 Tax=Cymbomonas tetramitiformis TaxID=36881 RepID=A0AAE0KTM8_9CHLO|nr:hypothetical protein CYMTET_30939 [Cymbomonas tetramitiformis]
MGIRLKRIGRRRVPSLSLRKAFQYGLVIIGGLSATFSFLHSNTTMAGENTEETGPTRTRWGGSLKEETVISEVVAELEADSDEFETEFSESVPAKGDKAATKNAKDDSRGGSTLKPAKAVLPKGRKDIIDKEAIPDAQVIMKGVNLPRGDLWREEHVESLVLNQEGLKKSPAAAEKLFSRSDIQRLMQGSCLPEHDLTEVRPASCSLPCPLCSEPVLAASEVVPRSFWPSAVITAQIQDADKAGFGG